MAAHNLATKCKNLLLNLSKVNSKPESSLLADVPWTALLHYLAGEATVAEQRLLADWQAKVPNRAQWLQEWLAAEAPIVDSDAIYHKLQARVDEDLPPLED